MLQKTEKAFFMSVAIGASKLSGCGIKEGALLIHGHKIMSYGYNRDIIPGKEWSLSAVSDALMGSKENDLRDCELFCTAFPGLEDMKLIIGAGIKALYFLGDITNQDSVRFIKEVSSHYNYLEIVKLE